MAFHPAQFTQVNQSMNRRLIQSALAMVGDLRGQTVLDLFCGIGNFSLPLARAGARVIGVEVARDAVERAIVNAALNGLSDRVDFSAVDLYENELSIPQAVDAVLLDPPRSGAGPNLAGWLQALRQAQCHTIVYVSCNPVSFASDAGCLREHGFELANVGIFDMFPHTGHVETMGHFVRLTAGSM
jgi:23S rRNA (uracil1939-C5)-methyltransferase